MLAVLLASFMCVIVFFFVGIVMLCVDTGEPVGSINNDCPQLEETSCEILESEVDAFLDPKLQVDALTEKYLKKKYNKWRKEENSGKGKKKKKKKEH